LIFYFLSFGMQEGAVVNMSHAKQQYEELLILFCFYVYLYFSGLHEGAAMHVSHVTQQYEELMNLF